MSHYTVLCNLGTDIDPTEDEAVREKLAELLAPYDENMDVEPYKKYMDKEEKGRRAMSCTEPYTSGGKDSKTYGPSLDRRWVNDPPTPRAFAEKYRAEHPEERTIPDDIWQAVQDQYKAELEAIADLYTDEEVAKAINDYWGYDEEDEDSDTQYADENGIYRMTTYNPDSKWDWYSVGGRWQGYFTTKGAGLLGEPGVFGSGQINPNEVDVLRVEDIDWDAMKRSSIEQSMRYYDEAGADQLLSWEDGVKKSDVTREEWQERKERKWAPATHSICDPVQGWLQREKMGWFGMGYDQTMTYDQWTVAWKQYIEGLDPKTVVAVVDCHI